MVAELQFVAVAAFLIWGLASSVCGLLRSDVDAELVQTGRQGAVTDVDAERAHVCGHERASRIKPRNRAEC
jgi:hypothetical protein